MERKSLSWHSSRIAVALGIVIMAIELQGASSSRRAPAPAPDVQQDSNQLITEGRQTFRFDTFGDEDFWGGQLGLHLAVAGSASGGIGSGLSPEGALRLGLKVDSSALPAVLQQQIQSGSVDMNDPAVTATLLQLNAVVGVTGFFDGQNRLRSIGIQCALCHSTVDDSLATGIGERLDGWANRDLDIGKIISLAPNLAPIADLLHVSQDTVRQVLRSWGPGKFDAELVLDGKAFQPNGKSAATLIPPAFGLQGVDLHTWTGWGNVTYWNAFVANIEMHGKGSFTDARLDNAAQFPIAAQAGLGHIKNEQDRITPKLSALHYYQLSLVAPAPPAGSFDEVAAQRGETVFDSAHCGRCHIEPIYTEPGWNMHTPAEVGVDSFQADRAPDHRYRTSPLRGLWTHQKSGFFHDGRFATLLDVVQHYDSLFSLGLTERQQNDLVQYLLSL